MKMPAGHRKHSAPPHSGDFAERHLHPNFSEAARNGDATRKRYTLMDTHFPIPLRAALRSRVRACRSFLLTPGSRPELFPSAPTGDAIIVDLESTVDPGDKGRARASTL